MNLRTIANFAFKNDNVKDYVSQFATEEQIDSFLTEANKNKDFKSFQKSIFKNIPKNSGFKYAENGENKYDSALNFVTSTINFFEEDYAKNLSDEHKNGKIDLCALGFNEEMIEQYSDILTQFDLDGDIKSFSVNEITSYILALDEQSKSDGIISFDDIQNIDYASFQESSKKYFDSIS